MMNVRNKLSTFDILDVQKNVDSGNVSQPLSPNSLLFQARKFKPKNYDYGNKNKSGSNSNANAGNNKSIQNNIVSNRQTSSSSDLEPSVTTLANENRKNRLQNAAITTPSPSSVVNPNEAAGGTVIANYRNIRTSSALSRRLIGLDENQKQLTTQNNNNPSQQAGSVASTKFSTSSSSQSESRVSRSPLLLKKSSEIFSQKVTSESQHPLPNAMNRPRETSQQSSTIQTSSPLTLGKIVSRHAPSKTFQPHSTSQSNIDRLRNKPTAEIVNKFLAPISSQSNPVVKPTLSDQASRQSQLAERARNPTQSNLVRTTPSAGAAKQSQLVEPGRNSTQSNPLVRTTPSAEATKQPQLAEPGRYPNSTLASSNIQAASNLASAGTTSSAGKDGVALVMTSPTGSSHSGISPASRKNFQAGLARRMMKKAANLDSSANASKSQPKAAISVNPVDNQNSRSQFPALGESSGDQEPQMRLTSLKSKLSSEQTDTVRKQQLTNNFNNGAYHQIPNTSVAPADQSRTNMQSSLTAQYSQYRNQQQQSHSPHPQQSFNVQHNTPQGNGQIASQLSQAPQPTRLYNGYVQESLNQTGNRQSARNNEPPLNFEQQPFPSQPHNLHNGAQAHPQATGNRSQIPNPLPPVASSRSQGSLPPHSQRSHAGLGVQHAMPESSPPRNPPGQGRTRPCLSPAGIPINRSYNHDDDTSMLSGGRQTVDTTSDPRSPDQTRQSSGFSESGGFNIHSSSTSESNNNQSPLLHKREPSPKKFGNSGGHSSRRLRVTQSSSSDYETDEDRGEERKAALFGEYVLSTEQNGSILSASQLTPDVASFFAHPNLPKDDETYDYGDRDDEDSQGSLSYEQRRQKEEREKSARKAAVAAAKKEMEGPFIKTDDVDHYRKTLDTPLSRTALGVAGAATVGCVLLGPVGLLVGAAAVGIGIGFLQIPEEQRQNMNNKATEAFRNAQESTFVASEKFSQSCAVACRDSGISDHVPTEIQTCCSGLTVGLEKATGANVKEDNPAFEGKAAKEERNNEMTGTKFIGNDSRKNSLSPMQSARPRDKKGKVACLRQGKILPIAEIYSLDPAAQPRAWIDILASAETSHDEKLEAIEEVIILAKDKQRARIFVEEGILDFLMWTIGRYFEKKEYNPEQNETMKWTNPIISSEEAKAAKRASVCCMTLGKSYCAAIHTEGDLQLMSLYERGTVPEERQLAQMLYEVPHHTRATKTDDPTIIIPKEEIFVMKQMTLQQAGELSAKIKALAVEIS